MRYDTLLHVLLRGTFHNDVGRPPCGILIADGNALLLGYCAPNGDRRIQIHHRQIDLPI